ncbi:MAG: DUF86 domain-containing protein [Candidatus Atribacteria bacterium]|nr:DUF86 domain-containing protein [Candidatus Atribacteria bacterium]
MSGRHSRNIHVDEELGRKLIQMAGYRNRLVPMYNIVSDEELYQIIPSHLRDMEDFISEIKNYLKTFEN